MRLLITLAVIGALAFCGATVPLGKKTFFGHIAAIWDSGPAKDLKEGVKDTAAPAVDKGKDFVKGGMEAIKKKDGSGSDAEHKR